MGHSVAVLVRCPMRKASVKGLTFNDPLDAIRRAEQGANMSGSKFCLVAWGGRLLVKRYSVALSLGERILEVVSPVKVGVVA